MKRILYALFALVAVICSIAVMPITTSAAGKSIAVKSATPLQEEGRFEVKIQVPGSDIYSNVVVTDYMSKWVNLDTNTIKLIDSNLSTTIWTSTEGWLISENRPTAQEKPIVVAALSSEKYAEGGSRVIGNETGTVYKLTWYVKDSAVAQNHSYSLVYEIAIDTQETGFQYDVNYPVNGNTTISYKETYGEEVTKVVEDIPVPEVMVVKEETPETTEPTETTTPTTEATEPTETTQPETKPTEPETININGKVIWKDKNDKYGKRPKCITVNLITNGVEADYQIVTEKDNWKYTFKNVAKYDAKGRKITYTISEDEVANYETKIKDYNITNTYVEPEEPTTESTTEPETEPETQETINTDEKNTDTTSSKTGTLILILLIVLVILIIILIVKKR